MSEHRHTAGTGPREEESQASAPEGQESHIQAGDASGQSTLSSLSGRGAGEMPRTSFDAFLEAAPDAVVVVGREGRIAIVNTLTEKMFGYRREEMLGQSIEMLVPERFRHMHERDRSGYERNPRTRPMGAGQELWGRRKDGTEFPVEISLSPLETEQGRLVTSIIRDTTERRVTEERIKASLREKEVLLKEIHHRVKNNLQVTSSLLKLQSMYIQDPAARELFAESQNRIRSMALVHEKLYQSSDLSQVNFSDYVESLAALLFRSYGVDPERITLRLETEKAFLSIETAVPCGLIINELLSNCLKHAFPAKRAGQVRIRIASLDHGQRLLLAVADNGAGLPSGIDIENGGTLGLQLVRTLSRQINGQMEVSTGEWTEFRVLFTPPKNSE
jgi:PAS domain S-box-containing protein